MASTDPRTATQEQWEDLIGKVKAKQDELTAGDNISIASESGALVISATDTTYSAGTNVNISSGNVISATDTTYSAFTGATGSAAGTSGLVPAPAATDNTKYLRGDGTWQTASYSLPAATTSTLGGVIVGSGLSVQNDGTISADTQAETFTTNEWNALWA